MGIRIHHALVIDQAPTLDARPALISVQPESDPSCPGIDSSSLMGIPMDSIHAPTVQSGPTSGPGPVGGLEQSKLSLFELMAEKDRLEAEITALGDVLDSHGVHMNTSLTTFDGYPRDDLDVAQIRTVRARIIPLRNDYKALMNRIEAGLHSHHAAMASSASQQWTSPTSAPDTPATLSVAEVADIPFAKVNSVVSGSPAEDAGLTAGDGIRRFGSVNWMNHEKLSKVAETVQRNEGIPIMVRVVRRDAETGTDVERSLRLVPRTDWGGRGMLGCHLVAA